MLRAIVLPATRSSVVTRKEAIPGSICQATPMAHVPFAVVAVMLTQIQAKDFVGVLLVTKAPGKKWR